MTHREKQILDWIAENPMISQQELAEKAGITRSSVAVHISNLMKKGYIAGKGYVVQREQYTVVIGGLNHDIGGKPMKSLILKDSNPGRVTNSIGGVGHNIACNMALLGLNVTFLTALGDDSFTKTVSESCHQMNIDLTRSIKVPGQSSATYLFIADETGDMELAISDMEIFRFVTPQYLEKNINIINRARIVVVDTNIPQESIEWLAENCTAPIFADPVSTTKAMKLKNVLGKLHTIKPNRMEAEVLTGIPIKDEADLEKAAKALLKTGLKRVFISLGGEGVYCANEKETVHLPCPKAELINTTGGGDAFMGALAWAHLHEKNLSLSGAIGGGAAAIAVECSQTINMDLNIGDVLTRAGIKL